MLGEVPKPRRSGKEVLIRVTAVGLCHSDLFILDGLPEGWEAPFTLGHEVVGVVEDAPPGSEYLKEQEVLVLGAWGCGDCKLCAKGLFNLCPRRWGASCGLGRDGGLAEYLLVPSGDFLVPVLGLDPMTCVPLADAGLTAYTAATSSPEMLNEGGSALVIGAGGLGLSAIQILKSLGCGFVAVSDIREEALAAAEVCGADYLLDGSDFPGNVGSAAPEGFELVIDMVGTERSAAQAVEVLAPGGHLCVVGMTGESIAAGNLVGPRGYSISFPSWGSLGDLREVVKIARRGEISMPVSEYRFDEVAQAYEHMRSGSLVGRAVVRM